MNAAYGFEEFLSDLCKHDGNPNDQILSYLSQTDVNQLKRVLSRMDKVRALKPSEVAATRKAHHPVKAKKQAQAQQSRLVGKLLEGAIRVLLDGCKCISHGGNVRTTISEVDFLIQTNGVASVIPIFKAAVTHVMGEAKCYSSGLKVEWINELVGIMKAHNTTHSILFVACPPKKLRPEHRFAIQLQSVGGMRVVPFGMTQLKEIMGGKNFLQVLSDQYIKAINGTNELCI